MFSLESPHRSDSNEYTQYTIFNTKKKITLNYSKSAAMVFFSFKRSQERVRNTGGKRTSSVRATEGLPYMHLGFDFFGRMQLKANYIRSQ